MLTDDRLRELWDEALGTPYEAITFARAVEAEARKAALEEAAKAVEKRTEFHTPYSASWHAVAKCAAAIRALIDRP